MNEKKTLFEEGFVKYFKLEMVDIGKLNKDIERTIITKNCPKTLASDSVTKQVCGSAEFEK